jgi:hypothetical protein
MSEAEVLGTCKDAPEFLHKKHSWCLDWKPWPTPSEMLLTKDDVLECLRVGYVAARDAAEKLLSERARIKP